VTESESEPESEDPSSLAERIDAFFESADRESSLAYGPGADVALEMFTLAAPFKATEFVNAYRVGGIYPEERLSELVLRFTDVRLQIKYLEFDGGLANHHYYGPINQNPALKTSPQLTLNLMAIDQSVIGRSRIAWEKLMRAVYFLEMGEDLKPSGSGSYKKKFFDWVANHEKWLFLEPYNAVVTEHDARYRTGEYHKNSVLRRRILGQETPEVNDFLRLLNYMYNCIWPNVISIVGGGSATHFSDLHAVPGSEHGIHPRYLPVLETTTSDRAPGESLPD
jgi:hypothetical protein